LGNVIWVSKIPLGELNLLDIIPRDIKTLPDGTFLVSTNYAYYMPSQVLTYFEKHKFFHIGSDGSILDSVSNAGGSEAYLSKLIPIKDGNFLAVGLERDSAFNATGNKGILMKMTQDLKVKWKRKYRVSPPESKLHEKFYDAIEMPDRGFIVTGRAFGPLEDSTNSNGWVIRVDSLGCLTPGCDSVTTNVDSPGTNEDGVNILIQPNPASGQVMVTVEPASEEIIGMKLVAMNGAVLEDVQFKRGTHIQQTRLSLQNLEPGVFILMVRTGKGWYARKLVKVGE
jgi:hypothetical protein